MWIRGAWCLLSAVIIVLTGCELRHGAQPDCSGTIECTQVQVAAQAGGRLLRLPPQEGALIKRGDLVAQIDTADYILRRNESAALYAQAEAQLALVRAGSRDEDIQRAREQVREAMAGATASSNDLRRMDALFGNGSATEKQRDDARSAFDRAIAVVAAAEQNFARFQAGSRKEDIRVAETQVDVAKSRLAQAEKALQDCTLASPVDGTVTTRSHEEGDMVAAGATLLTLSRLDDVWLAIYVPETRLGKVSLGQTVRVAIDGVDRRFEGKVTFISPEAEFTPKDIQTPDQRAKLVYRVKVTLPNEERIFKPGMPADAYLEKQ
jgi:HlyD family secretion protein